MTISTKESAANAVMDGKPLKRIAFGGGVYECLGCAPMPSQDKAGSNDAKCLCIGKDFGSSDDLKSLEDNSITGVKFIFTLERVQDDFLSFMSELYRVCADGALIEIRASSAYYCEKSNDPTLKRCVNEQLLNLLDKEQRTNTIAALGSSSNSALVALHAINKLNLDFKLIHKNMQLSAAATQELNKLALNSQEQLVEIINKNPQAIESQSFYLACRKDDKHHFGLVRLPDIVTVFGNDDFNNEANAKLEPGIMPFGNLEPFVLRIYDPNDGLKYLSQQVVSYGYWELVETRVFACFINLFSKHYDNFKFANIGANVGWYSLIAARMSSHVTVDAFEPNAQSMEMFKQSTCLNQLEQRINFYDCALSNSVGETSFFINETNDMNSCMAKTLDEYNTRGEVFTQTKVKTDTLDNIYLNKDSSEWPNIILIDTEGHEQFVFDGAKGLFEKGFRPLVIAEFCPAFAEANAKPTYYHDFAKKYGYKLYGINTNDVNKALYPCDIEYIDKLYVELQTLVDNDVPFINVVFIPENMEEKDGFFVFKDDKKDNKSSKAHNNKEQANKATSEKQVVSEKQAAGDKKTAADKQSAAPAVAKASKANNARKTNAKAAPKVKSKTAPKTSKAKAK